MYIQPNSIIVLCNNVPLSPSYTDTIYFNNLQEQYEYFHSKRQLTFSSQTYQRRGRNYIRLQVAPSQMKWAMSCNYLYFNNTSYEDKWFYAFITSTEYINDNTVEVSYIVDELQTWLFEMDLGECFIERQHSTTDEIGDNILPEPVDVGEYIFSDYRPLYFEVEYEEFDEDGERVTNRYSMRDKTVLVLSSYVNTGITDSNFYGGIYGGGTLYAFRISSGGTGIGAVDSFIEQYLENPDDIIAIYMCPSNVVPPLVSNVDSHAVPPTAIATPIRETCGTINGTEGFGIYDNSYDDGGLYVPKNKKLYTYPYNFLSINNGGSGTLALRYEFGRKTSTGYAIDCELNGTFNLPVGFVLRPVNYKNVVNKLHTENLSLDGFPQCSWNVDSFKAWIAQNAFPLAISGLTTAGSLSTTTPVYTKTTVTQTDPLITQRAKVRTRHGKPQTVTSTTVTDTVTDVPNANLGNAIGMVGDFLTQSYTASISADVLRGVATNGSVNYANNDMIYHSTRCCVDYTHAEMIDKFLTMYGYAQNKVSVPNINARENFTYVKTISCELHGNMPSEANEAICNIFDNGVRWWKDPELVGNYNVSNEPRY